MEWMLLPLRRYADFSGRSRRREYWLFMLLVNGVGWAAGLLQLLWTAAAGHPSFLWASLSTIFSFAMAIPSLAVNVRRFHDHNQSGWSLLVIVAPMVLILILGWTGFKALADLLMLFMILIFAMLIVLFCQRGTVGPNRFGPDPIVQDE